MRGFAITPLLFVGIFLIVGLMLLNFTDTDFRITKSISQEARLAELQEALMENRTSAGNLLFQYSVQAAPLVNYSWQLEQVLKEALGGPVNITDCTPDSFRSCLNYTFYKKNLDSEINRSYTISRVITCEAIKDITGQKARIDCGSVTVNCA